MMSRGRRIDRAAHDCYYSRSARHLINAAGVGLRMRGGQVRDTRSAPDAGSDSSVRLAPAERDRTVRADSLGGWSE
jgi:hypothetical protein